MDTPTRTPEPMEEPFAFLLDDYCSIELEASFTQYRNDKVMDENPNEEEKRRARHLHSRLREDHTLGAGATLTINNDEEAQTVLNALAYYEIEPDAKFRQRCVEELTTLIFQHSAAQMADVPIITDFLDEENLDVQPEDLKQSPKKASKPVGQVDIQIGIKQNVDPA